MPTIVIGFVDSHWTEKKPRSRRDDYRQTQIRKLNDIRRLASGIKIDGEIHTAQAIAIAGDLFHQPKGELISRFLECQLSPVIREFPCPFFAIPGNHDMWHNRIESLDYHPMGAMIAAGLVTMTNWPKYQIVKGPKEDDPEVIVTGVPFTIEGPNDWLSFLETSHVLKNLKTQISPRAQALLMTHNHWGPQDTYNMGEPVTGHNRVRGTGANVLLYGHPHTFDGETIVQDESGPVSIVGPGALTRGTIAEHDVNRQPRIAVMVFYPDQTHKVILVTIPHEPPEIVFDLEKHERQRQEKKVQERFVQEIQSLGITAKEPEEIITQAETTTPAPVIAKTRQFILQATAEVEK